MKAHRASGELRRGPGRPRDPGLAHRRSEQILRAATRVMARKGYAGADLQDVADVLRVGKGTIYRYFPSKTVLFEAAADRVMQLMQAAIDQAKAGIEDPLDAIAAAIRGYLRFFDVHPEFVELLIQERAVFRDRKTPTYFEYRKAHIGRWHDVYRRLMDEDRIRRMNPERITDVMGGLIYGTMFTNFMAGRTKTVEEQAAEILDLVFNGLLTERERSRRAPEKGGAG